MNILLIVLIAYFVYSYIFALIYLFKVEGVGGGIGYNFGVSLLVIPITIFMMITMPFVGIMWFVKAINRIKMDTFTIHELTEENKVALRQLWFDEGEFVSASNFVYEGFRKRVGTTKIYISNNGYVCIWGDLTSEVEFYKKTIKCLLKPKPEPEPQILKNTP